jgi:hypothetical protein
MGKISIFLLSAMAGCLLLSCSANPAVSKTGTLDSSRLELLDTSKIKSDIEKVISSANSGKPDTSELKTAGADVLATAAAMLSDSGISKMGGNNQDPGVRQAKAMFRHMRDSIGITSAALDSMRNASKKLSSQ